MKPRKARSLDDLLQDSALAYRIGQLIGAVEMTAWRLSMHEDEEMKDLALKLQQVSDWFFTDLPGD